MEGRRGRSGPDRHRWGELALVGRRRHRAGRKGVGAIPTAKSTGPAPSQRRGRVRLVPRTPLCSGSRWNFRASMRRSLQSGWCLTRLSASTWPSRKSRLSRGSRTHFMSWGAENTTFRRDPQAHWAPGLRQPPRCRYHLCDGFFFRQGGHHPHGIPELGKDQGAPGPQPPACPPGCYGSPRGRASPVGHAACGRPRHVSPSSGLLDRPPPPKARSGCH